MTPDGERVKGLDGLLEPLTTPFHQNDVTP